ncbi:S53 family peptidase [Streptacidiphilus sp. ASG 303]|uniref:S53 family peptidase n=1 Tax=Streptacidiphilus sp. ASG 303 TaxID=2896847 RepID=UPI001E32C068|nr:S53 family peptidase [Streptacidiphilus sp. ASG 303]MCD0484525.1 S53 family peptidase [Streptacidiphilus sp. ASG 303]
MHLRARLFGIGTAALTAIPLALLGPAATASNAATLPAQATAHSCATAQAGAASCNAIVRTDIAPLRKASPNATPSGYGPSSLQSAYNLPSSTAGAGRTVAIVDAYDDPTAEADLGVYRSQYGLPACTTANGCFKKIDQNGGTHYPRTNGGWAQEISLDIDMVSAVCPNCHILLVEAKSASFADLGAAVNRAAATPGVVAISNSYSGSDAADSSYGAYYNHPGIALTASSGDSGYGAGYPASSHYVTAVGGTSLTSASNARGWTETAWSGAGSGCSSYNAALSAAASFGTGCSMRAEADVSAVADPATGVAVYDSTSYQGRSGWLVFGGTSVSSPVIASVYALAGNTSSIDNNYPYTHSSSLWDVTSGSNGTCPTSQWCNARAGWDGPTGLGTPNGVGAF